MAYPPWSTGLAAGLLLTVAALGLALVPVVAAMAIPAGG